VFYQIDNMSGHALRAKLAELHAAGVLTDEFATKKTELLARM
jgi:hypothetical protein